MSAPRDPRATRIQDYTTNAALRCAHISRKSGRILATGDREKQVQLYAVPAGTGAGSPGGASPHRAHLLNLTGHATAIESVCLDWTEELVIGGAASGVIKLWDLEHAKGAFFGGGVS